MVDREDIILMAREAGAKDYGTGEEGVTALMLKDDAIEHFAALVAAAEREECAKVCEEQYEYYGYDHVFATKIRARGNK